MTVQTNAALRRNLVELVLSHLECESKFLDVVLEFCQQMTSHLHAKRSNSHANTQQQHHQLTLLRSNLTRHFAPIEVGRQRFRQAINAFGGATTKPLTLMQVAAEVEPVFRERLLALRTEFKSKLQTVQALLAANQVVLIYTMDFFQRLLAGLTGSVDSPGAYSPHGTKLNYVSGSTVERSC